MSVLEILLVLPVKLKLSRLWISHGLSVISIYSEEKCLANVTELSCLCYRTQYNDRVSNSITPADKFLRPTSVYSRNTTVALHGDANGTRICTYRRQNS